MLARHAPLHNPSRVVCISNSFVFNKFRTHVRDRNPLNSFPSNRLRTTSSAAEGWALTLCSLVSDLRCFAHFALCYPLSFHTNTNYPFCNSFLLITIRIARGVGTPLPVRHLKLYFKSLPRCPVWASPAASAETRRISAPSASLRYPFPCSSLATCAAGIPRLGPGRHFTNHDAQVAGRSGDAETGRGKANTQTGRRVQKHRGRNGLATAAPSFNCAVKFLRFPGSIWEGL